MPEKETRGRPIKDPSGKTQAKLAEEAGVSLATWKMWQRDQEIGGAELADRKKRAEIQRIDTATEKEQLYLSILHEQYLPRKELETALMEVASVCDALDSAILSDLPSLLAGLTPAQIEKELKTFVDDWKTIRKNARSEPWKVAREAVQRELKGDMKKVAAHMR